MRRQLAKIINNGTWRIIYDDAKDMNPYRITKDNKKVVDYQDYVSCMYHMADVIFKGE